MPTTLRRSQQLGPIFMFTPHRVGTWNEELVLELDAGGAQYGCLQLDVRDATLREQGLKACTFHMADLVPWNGYHLDVRETTTNE